MFLACPGDLVSERSKFPRLIDTVNSLRAHNLGFHLEAVGWERVIPSFRRPQCLINRELEQADLVVVLFWNRIGSPSSKGSSTTGTVEEFELARRLHAASERPLTWVYFRKPTAEGGQQLESLTEFRRSIEKGQDLFFREYESVEEFEEMFLQHLVAYLDGLRRWDIEANYLWMRPEHALMEGRFLAEGIYAFGSKMELAADLDGDGNEEEVTFWYSHGAFSLSVRRFDKRWFLELPGLAEGEGFEPRIIHVAVKDVTNDGLPEVLLAAYDGMIDLRLAVYGFVSCATRNSRVPDLEHFSLLQVLTGQRTARVLEGGTIILPYGSAGLASNYRWSGERFDCTDES